MTNLLRQGPKRKGVVVFEVSMEVKEKEKWLKRSEDVGTGLISLGSTEAMEQPRRV